jgi:hypothetical protein
MISLLRLADMHDPWQDIDQAIKQVAKMITDHERFLTEVKRASGEGLQGIHDEYKNLEV